MTAPSNLRSVLALLRRFEWASFDSMTEGDCCPVCSADIDAGHKPTCRLAATILDLEAQQAAPARPSTCRGCGATGALGDQHAFWCAEAAPSAVTAGAIRREVLEAAIKVVDQHRREYVAAHDASLSQRQRIVFGACADFGGTLLTAIRRLITETPAAAPVLPAADVPPEPGQTGVGAPAGSGAEPLCEDEGCPHYGTPHVCRTAEPQGANADLKKALDLYRCTIIRVEGVRRLAEIEPVEFIKREREQDAAREALEALFVGLPAQQPWRDEPPTRTYDEVAASGTAFTPAEETKLFPPAAAPDRASADVFWRTWCDTEKYGQDAILEGLKAVWPTPAPAGSRQEAETAVDALLRARDRHWTGTDYDTNEAVLKAARERVLGMMIGAPAGSRDVEAENARLREALKRIERWFGEFPVTGKFWDGDRTRPMSYAACFGSAGERDFMRGIARAALASSDADDEGGKDA